jgi:hypothetical protein
MRLSLRRLLLFLLRPMVTHCAPNRSTRHPMVTCHMAGDGPHGRALDATMRTGDGRKHGYR